MAKRIEKRTLRADHLDVLVRRGPRTIVGKMRLARNARRQGGGFPCSTPEFPVHALENSLFRG